MCAPSASPILWICKLQRAYKLPITLSLLLVCA